MRIRTQFIITMILFGIILAVIAASAISTHRQVDKANEQEKIASSIARGASELSYLSNDYLIYRESQQLSRWQSRFASFSSEVARLRAEKPEQQTLIRNIQANQQRLKQVFESVASAVRGSSQKRSSGPDLAFLQVSWSRMAVQSQGVVSDASRLSQLLHQQMDQLTNTRSMLIYFMVGLFGAFLLASYMLTYRRILKSLLTLQARTAVIGSGNLDFIIEEKENDEIGDLSHAFNQMTTNLKAVTASKGDLEREVTERKKAEEDLRQQREWLRVTLSSIGDAVIASDTEGRITFLNPVAAALTGWQLEETLGQPIQRIFRIINEKNHQPAEDLVARVLSEKRVVGLANDTALVTKDGREVPIEDSAAPILDSAGSVIGAVLVFHDVSEKRRAQAALREALERAVWLARFPDENPNPVQRVSADGTMLYCNPASEEIIGWGCEVGKPLQGPLLPLIEQAMTEAEEATQDMELGGRFYLVTVTPFPGEGYVNVYGRDITERKQAEEELRESRRRLSVIVDSIADGFYALDREWRFTHINDTALRFFRRNREDVLGYTIFDVFQGFRGSLFETGYLRAMGSGEPVHIQAPSIVTDRIVEIHAYPGQDNMTILFRDITERVRTEEALQQRTLELQQLTETLEQQVQERTEELGAANKALRQLSIRLLSAHEEERKRIAGELHDTIGACLSGIKFKVEDSLQRIGKKADVETHSLKTIVPVIQEAVEECRRIQLDLRPSMLDDLGLLPTLSWFSRRFQTIYSRIRVDQKVTIEESDVPDSLKIVIYRVIQEAMNNCAKHSEANSICLSLQKIDGNIELLLEDNGQGFDLRKLIDTESTKRGFGLTSMRERTELSGGSFDIESVVGKGTIIRARWSI